MEYKVDDDPFSQEKLVKEHALYGDGFNNWSYNDQIDRKILCDYKTKIYFTVFKKYIFSVNC